ncbi:MAG: hypothetical protein ACJ704_03115 [Nitrososphaeraceae archaeon]
MSSDTEQQQEQQQQEQLQCRRDKVQELCSKGYSQREVSQVLQVGLATVNRIYPLFEIPSAYKKSSK